MIRSQIACTTVAVAFVSAQALAQLPAAENTTNRAHPFVTHAEQIYQQHLDSERRGDTELYKRTRTKEAYEASVENLRRMGMSVSDLGPMLKDAVAWQTDISKFKFLRCDSKGDIARLLYQREGKDGKGSTVEFAVFMIHWENGAWRIGSVGNSPGPKVFMGKERTVDELLESSRFALK